MQAWGIPNMMRAVKDFDPSEKSDRPFAGTLFEHGVRGQLRTTDGIEVSMSSHEAKMYLGELSEALDAVHRGLSPKGSAIAWPAGLSGSIGFDLELITRDRHGGIVHSHFSVEGHGPLTVDDVLRMKNCSQGSLNELLLAAEAFLKRHVGNENPYGMQADVLDDEPPNVAMERVALDQVLSVLSTPWEMVGRALAPVLAASRELNRTAKLSDALSPEFARMAARMGINLGAIDLFTLTNGTVGPLTSAARRLEECLEDFSSTQRMVVELRLASSPRKTLEEVGFEIGVTRERVRQIQEKLERRIRYALGSDIRFVAAVLKEEQGPVVPKGHLDRRIDGVLAGQPTPISELIRNSLVAEMDYKLVRGYCLNDQAANLAGSLRRLAEEIADDVGLVDKEALIADLPGNDWRVFWPAFQHCCQFHDLYGFLSVRNSLRAHVKAAILSVGRPATKQEIARVSGLEEGQLGASLSNIESVTRADKHRWGIKEWIDDEYEGIVAEIVQRIDEDGGATTVERLLTELPEKFGVRPNSVHMFMQTDKFIIRNGLVSLAHESDLRLRNLDDVISGRDGEGDPYWTFLVEARFFDGYSVTGIPPEFAKALGCEPDEPTSVRVVNLPDWWDLSLSWRLASTTGASVGYLAKPLQQMGVQPGQKVRITIKGEGIVDLTVDEETADRSSAHEADAIVQRMIQRRRGL